MRSSELRARSEADRGNEPERLKAMISNTINDDKAIAGGGEGAIFAGRYHILRQLEQRDWA